MPATIPAEAAPLSAFSESLPVLPKPRAKPRGKPKGRGFRLPTLDRQNLLLKLNPSRSAVFESRAWYDSPHDVPRSCPGDPRG